MRSKLPQTERSFFAILLVVMFSIVLACGSEAVVATPVPNTSAAASPFTAIPDPTEPVLANTPVPVANTAPDFTLPSVQGPEYTLSQFRGEQPVVVVFYRAYW